MLALSLNVKSTVQKNPKKWLFFVRVCVTAARQPESLASYVYRISLSVFHFHLCSLASQVFSASALLHLTVCLSICLCHEAAERGGGGLYSPYVQQGSPFLTLIRSAITKSAFTLHTFYKLHHDSVWREIG